MNYLTPTVSPQRRPRATLVLDANFLIDLAGPVPNEHRNSNPRYPMTHYLDLLPFLANHGYRILIPQMVSLEVAQVLADGKSTSKVFPSGFKHSESMLLRPFLKSVARGDVPNMSIVADTGPEAADQFCRKLHEALEPARYPVGRKGQKPGEKKATRKAVLDATQVFKQDLGDKAILALAETLSRDRQGEPLFVFSNDKDMNVQLPAGVNQMRTRPFFHHLIDAGLAEHVGLASDANAEDISKHIHEMHSPDPEVRKRYAVQFAPKNTERFLQQLHGSPSRLLETLEALKCDLDKAPQPPASEPETSHTHRNAAARRAVAFGSLNLRGK